MDSPTVADLTPLPAPVAALLDAFRHAHPGAELRLWAGAGDDWICVYPNNGASADGQPPKARQPIEVTEGPPLALEVRGSDNGAPLDQVFLAQAVSQVLQHEREARSAARELTERYEEAI